MADVEQKEWLLHELLDRASTLVALVDAVISDHPAIKEANLEKEMEELCCAVVTFYEACADKRFAV